MPISCASPKRDGGVGQSGAPCVPHGVLRPAGSPTRPESSIMWGRPQCMPGCQHPQKIYPAHLRSAMAVSASRVPHVFHMGFFAPPDLRPGLIPLSDETHRRCGKMQNPTWSATARGGDHKTYNLERIGDARENIYRSGVGEDVEVAGDVAVDTLLPCEPGCVFAQSVGHGRIGIGHACR